MKSTYHRLYRNTIRLITNATTVSRARDDFGRLQCEAQGVEWRGQVGTVPLPVTAEDYIETRRWVKQAYQRQGNTRSLLQMQRENGGTSKRSRSAGVSVCLGLGYPDDAALRFSTATETLV